MEKHPDYLTFNTKLALPGLAIIATIASIKNAQPGLAWSLFGLTILLVLMGFGPTISRAVKSFVDLRHDDRVARLIWQDVVILVDRFGPFVNSVQADTIHAVVQSPSGSEVARALHSPCLLPIDVLYGIWDQVRCHAQQPAKDFNALRRTLDAFMLLLWTYNSYVVQPVYSWARREIRSADNGDLRSALELSREQYLAVVDDYARLIERTNPVLHIRKLTMPAFRRPSPV